MRVQTPKSTIILAIGSAILAFFHFSIYLFVMITKGVIAFSVYKDENLNSFLLCGTVNLIIILISTAILFAIMFGILHGRKKEYWNKKNCIWPISIISIWYILHNLIPSTLEFVNTYSLSSINEQAKVTFMAMDNLIAYVNTFQELAIVSMIVATTLLCYDTYHNCKDSDNIITVFHDFVEGSKEKKTAKDIEMIKNEEKNDEQTETNTEEANDTEKTKNVEIIKDTEEIETRKDIKENNALLSERVEQENYEGEN